jgi:crossover junction endodeoxyribonuclease RuvC
MRVLGIDPGTATTGYGIVDGHEGQVQMVTYGAIQTSSKLPMPERLVQIYAELAALIQEYRPDAAAIEELFFGRNVTTAITVGQARGVLILALAHAGVSIAEYKPAVIKQTIAGYGQADKAQMQLMVRHLLDLEETPRPDDAADGLAIALTHYQYQQYQALL